MEIMQGKHTREMNADEFALIKSAYQQVLMDIGTGDGRFVLQTARTRSILAIGIDACRENLRAACRGNASVLHMERKSEGQAVASLIPATGSSARPGSVLFVIAEASRLPAELNRLASLVTVNFPWGSLRDGLLNGDAALLEGIRSVMHDRLYHLIWLGQIVSVLASSMSHFALSIWMYQQTESATAMGLMQVFFITPFLLISPFAGVMVDRYNRKLMMMLSDLPPSWPPARLIFILYATGPWSSGTCTSPLR
jgi:hypothetical protein